MQNNAIPSSVLPEFSNRAMQELGALWKYIPSLCECWVRGLGYFCEVAGRFQLYGLGYGHAELQPRGSEHGYCPHEVAPTDNQCRFPHFGLGPCLK
jgi:hypothetical protein